MRIITLTTDFGERDYAVAAVKGKIYTEIPNVTVVDISHLIAPFDVMQTHYILKNAYHHFPKGSVHIIGVDAEATPERKYLIMKLKGHYFIGADNGIFHLISENESDVELYELFNTSTKNQFPVLHFFPKVAKDLLEGVSLQVLGNRIEKCFEMSYFKPEVSDNKTFITGTVIYIDHYGNAVSNIPKSLFHEVGQGRAFEVIFNMYSFTKIHENYSDIIDFSIPKQRRAIPDGERLILFNSLDYLQVSVYKSNLHTVGGASSLLGIDYLDQVSIRFLDKKK
ncbi:SAM hydrolase/SAM-dependent halogenase family protein [Capnocytophaga canis]|uniref:SAM hydrolase/SAM-dependent halogenase family protein n=1 Tax=Capnocytophaga canis TaxID=1848903 RepID=UPI0015627194|nr:SAM-dependent chlorinase/fluorinase [Capnocytophaga canis]